jgi:hypothetical protein
MAQLPPPSSSGTSTTSAGAIETISAGLYRRRSDDCKLVGEFSSREEVDAAAERKRGYPGFGDEPDCFFVTEYPWTPICGRTASCLRNRPAQPLQTGACSEAGVRTLRRVP